LGYKERPESQNPGGGASADETVTLGRGGEKEIMGRGEQGPNLVWCFIVRKRKEAGPLPNEKKNLALAGEATAESTMGKGCVFRKRKRDS